MHLSTLYSKDPQAVTSSRGLETPPSSGDELDIPKNNVQQDVPDLAWSHSDEASNDFRSDFFTKPTLPMLQAIMATTLGDGDMDEDPTTNSFQEYMAGLIGHESALLVVSGTMGNQVALRSALCMPPHSILADHRGHIVTLEGGGASSLCGALMKTVVPSNGHHLTLSDVKKHCTLTETVYDCPTRIICLENTLSGTIMPLSEIQAISKWARAQKNPIHMHLDGARLWEALAANSCTLRDMGECFDSIQLCFTKGLGAPIGSIVTGSAAFIKRAKWARKLLGGSTRASGIIAAPARVAVDDVFFGGKLQAAHEMARRASVVWEQLGGKLQLPTETNMIWLDLEASGLDQEKFYAAADRFNIKIGEPILGRLVFHYQINNAAFERLCSFFHSALVNRVLEVDPTQDGKAIDHLMT